MIVKDLNSIAEILDYYGKSGFKRASINEGYEFYSPEIENGTLVLENPTGRVYIKHNNSARQVTEHDLREYSYRQSSQQNLGDYFMLYQALEDILKINRLDMVDLQHDETFNFAQEVINKFRKDGN